MSTDNTLHQPKVVDINPKLLNKLIAIASASGQINQHASIITKGKVPVVWGTNDSRRQRIMKRLVPCVHSETNVLAQLKYRLLRGGKAGCSGRQASKVRYRQKQV